MALFLLGVFHCGALQAGQPAGEIRMRLAAEPPIWVGQQVTVNLDLLTTGFTFANQDFMLPEVPGGFFLRIDTTTIKLTERRGAETWQVLRYPLALFPQRGGRLEVPPFEVRFSASAGFGQEPRFFTFLTEPLSMDVEWPPGVEEGGLLVTTADYQVQAEWQPRPDIGEGQRLSLRQGAALRLEVTQNAADLSGMVLPPVPVHTDAGLAAYPETPVVRDRAARGVLRGGRTDSVTWVFEQPGRYVFPDIRYRWFDPEARALKETRIPGPDLEVVASASEAGRTSASPAAKGEAGARLSWLLPALVALAGIGGMIWYGRRRRSTKRGPSGGLEEAGLYRAALVACRANDAAAAYAALSRWVSASADGRVTLLDCAAARSPEFHQEAEALQRALARGLPWNGQALARILKGLRKRRRASFGRRYSNALAPLNPPGGPTFHGEEA